MSKSKVEEISAEAQSTINESQRSSIEFFKSHLIEHLTKAYDPNGEKNQPAKIFADAKKSTASLSRIFDAFPFPVLSFAEMKMLSQNPAALRDHMQTLLVGILPVLLNEERTALHPSVIDASGIDNYQSFQNKGTEQEIALQFIKAIFVSYGQRVFDNNPNQQKEIFQSISPALEQLASRVTTTGLPEIDPVEQFQKMSIKDLQDQLHLLNQSIENVTTNDFTLPRVAIIVDNIDGAKAWLDPNPDLASMPDEMKLDKALESYNRAVKIIEDEATPKANSSPKSVQAYQKVLSVIVDKGSQREADLYKTLNSSLNDHALGLERLVFSLDNMRGEKITVPSYLKQALLDKAQELRSLVGKPIKEQIQYNVDFSKLVTNTLNDSYKAQAEIKPVAKSPPQQNFFQRNKAAITTGIFAVLAVVSLALVLSGVLAPVGIVLAGGLATSLAIAGAATAGAVGITAGLSVAYDESVHANSERQSSKDMQDRKSLEQAQSEQLKSNFAESAELISQLITPPETQEIVDGEELDIDKIPLPKTVLEGTAPSSNVQELLNEAYQLEIELIQKSTLKPGTSSDNDRLTAINARLEQIYALPMIKNYEANFGTPTSKESAQVPSSIDNAPAEAREEKPEVEWMTDEEIKESNFEAQRTLKSNVTSVREAETTPKEPNDDVSDRPTFH